LPLIRPSKKPKAGTIRSTSPVDMSIHDVSPELKVTMFQDLYIRYTHFTNYNILDIIVGIL